MLRRLRHKIHAIRYYSAPRSNSGWTRALDIALLASLLLAFPITWMSNEMVGQSINVISLNGQLLRRPDQSVVAILMSSAAPASAWQDAMPFGVFVLEVNDVHQGWPLTTKVSRPPARLHLDLRTDGRPRPNAQLDADDPIRIGIIAALERAEHAEAIASWPAGAVNPRTPVSVQQHWYSWVAAVALWWIMLTLVSGAVIRAAWFVTMIAQGKRAQRRARLRAEGKCLACGYDMTGLEFNERCPECGELVW